MVDQLDIFKRKDGAYDFYDHEISKGIILPDFPSIIEYLNLIYQSKPLVAKDLPPIVCGHMEGNEVQAIQCFWNHLGKEGQLEKKLFRIMDALYKAQEEVAK